jgi:uncharacterized protein (TIGR00369 family)
MTEGGEFVDPLLGGESPSGFQRAMGYRLAAWREGGAELVMPVRPHHLNRAGVLHGGVYMSLIDTACGLAGCYRPHPDRRRVAVSLSLTTSFVAQCSGGTVRVVGRARGGGRRIFIASAEVFDEDGRLLALGEGSYRYRAGSENPEGTPR